MASEERARRVHQVALTLLPTAAPGYEDVLSKPSRLYCAVELHDQPCNFDAPDTDSFLWIKANQRLQLSKLFAAYRSKIEGSEDVQFMMGDTIVDENSTVADLPPVRDQVLVLQAIKPEPVMETTSSFSGSASSQGSRPPLQPVNRQVSTPLKPSHDDLAVKREVLATPTGRCPLLPAEAAPMAPIVHMLPTLSAPSNANATTGPPNQESRPQQKQEPNDDGPEPQYEPRDQGNPFATSHEDQDPEAVVRGVPLSELTRDETPERLEAAVEAGLKVLDQIALPLQELRDNEDAQGWLKSLEKVRKEAMKTRTVVGVVGNTGAGKSSVINAMLDEERLVPTNCMRACTAVVTELSYNHSNNPAAKYRAEIEFIQPDDWRKELKILFQEVFDDSGHLSSDVSNPDSEAGVSYAKIRAVYNSFTKEMLAKSSVESLMKNKRVRSVLGTTKKINSRNSGVFYRNLQQYVDSKEKGTEKLDKNGNKRTNSKRKFEHWPLIKVVKIYTKAPALKTGAIVVDLPGVHDSNAARAAVAEGYMKQCSGLWIVAPINRAVDDKAAKKLLGDSFKRQLKFDGSYSAVSFICSKTDDISRMEAADSLRLGHEMAELEDKVADITSRRRRLKKELDEAKAKVKDYDSTNDQIEDDIEVWERLEAKIEDGKIVYAPSKSRKRKASHASPRASKRQRRTLDLEDEDYTDAEPAMAEQEEAEDDAQKQPLAETDIENKLNELKRLKKDARLKKRDANERALELQDQIDVLDGEEAELDAKQSAICIAGRNKYSRGAIQQDFAQGIKELDMETAEEEDPDNFNPDEDLRDYEEVARSLPVFCVSSRGYQKLSGRLKKDNDVAGFTSLEETEIPQLQAHCKKLTEKGRQANCRRFLNSIKQLLTSLALWGSDDGTGIKLTAQQRDAEKSFLNRKLKDLERALEKVVKDTLDDAIDTLHEQLFEKLRPAVQTAVQEASPKAASWGRPKQSGGLHHGTYRATVRRNGAYSGAAGPRDFNAELTEPIYKQLATIWEKVFQRRLPNILQSFKKSAMQVLKQFHIAVETRAREKGHGSGRLQIIGNTLDGYSNIFGDLCSGCVNQLNEGQREINREFNPAILSAMEPAYESAAEERGIGMFSRMKGIMTSHVDQEKDRMFQAASQQVRNSLLTLCKNIRENMLGKADDCYISMARDYMSAYSGVQVGEIKMSREERAARRKVDEAITNADDIFRVVLDNDMDALQASVAAGASVTGFTKDVPEDAMDIDDLEDEEGEDEVDDEDDDTDKGDEDELEDNSIDEVDENGSSDS